MYIGITDYDTFVLTCTLPPKYTYFRFKHDVDFSWVKIVTCMLLRHPHLILCACRVLRKPIPRSSGRREQDNSGDKRQSFTQAKTDESKPSSQKPEEPAALKASERPFPAQDKEEAKESGRGPPKKTEGLQVTCTSHHAEDYQTPH